MVDQTDQRLLARIPGADLVRSLRPKRVGLINVCCYQISLEIDTACGLLRTNYLLVAGDSRLVADEESA